MAKRFIDTNLFLDPWFRRLKPNNKCLWIYILCSCDHAGIWKADLELAEFSVGGKINLAELNNGKERILRIKEDEYFIPDFISFQYGELNDNVKTHQSVINILTQKNLIKNNKLVTVSEQLDNPLLRVQDIYIDKDKDNNINNTSNTSSEKKKKFGDFIYLTEREYQKLVELYGTDFTDACIARLDNYIGSHGKRYKSHYRTILNWVIDAELKTGEWEK